MIHKALSDLMVYFLYIKRLHEDIHFMECYITYKYHYDSKEAMFKYRNKNKYHYLY